MLSVATLDVHMAELERRHGSARKAAAAYGVDVSYWSRLKRGHKTVPSDELLMKMGLQPVAVLYQLNPEVIGD